MKKTNKILALLLAAVLSVSLFGIQAFAAEGEQRNAMLVQCMVNITLWLMIHRLPQNMGHERRECLYNDSVKWLRDVQNSKASPDLPTYAGADGETDAHNPVRYGSMPRYSITN